MRGHHQSVAWRQVAIDIETPVARRPSMPSRTAGDTKLHAASICSSANIKVGFQHERVPFDKDLITALRIRICSFQIEDQIGCGIGARRKDGGVIAAFGVNSRAGETQFDVLGKSPAARNIWSRTYEIEA